MFALPSFDDAIPLYAALFVLTRALFFPIHQKEFFGKGAKREMLEWCAGQWAKAP